MQNEELSIQLFIYIRIARQSVGYLINFGHKGELQWKRFILSDLHEKATRNTKAERYSPLIYADNRRESGTNAACG